MDACCHLQPTCIARDSQSDERDCHANGGDDENRPPADLLRVRGLGCCKHRETDDLFGVRSLGFRALHHIREGDTRGFATFELYPNQPKVGRWPVLFAHQTYNLTLSER